MSINYLQAQATGYQGPFSGTFRITSPYFGETDSGRPFVRMRLEDCNGHIYAYSWEEEVMRSAGLFEFSRAYIEGQLRTQRAEPLIEVQTLVPAKLQEYDIVRLIPQSICPRPELLLELQAAMRLLTIPALRNFVARVLADDSIAFPFVACPASINHHHNHPAGLLKHSLETFANIEPHRTFPRESYELGLVAALFHDIGKILTLTPQKTVTSLGSCMGHDKLTFEILGTALHRLESEWPEGAAELRYLLRWKSQRAIPHYNMADLVACSDRISAGLDMEKRKTHAA